MIKNKTISSLFREMRLLNQEAQAQAKAPAQAQAKAPAPAPAEGTPETPKDKVESLIIKMNEQGGYGKLGYHWKEINNALQNVTVNETIITNEESIKKLQTKLGVSVDGAIGPETLQAIAKNLNLDITIDINRDAVRELAKKKRKEEALNPSAEAASKAPAESTANFPYNINEILKEYPELSTNIESYSDNQNINSFSILQTSNPENKITIQHNKRLNKFALKHPSENKFEQYTNLDDVIFDANYYIVNYDDKTKKFIEPKIL